MQHQDKKNYTWKPIQILKGHKEKILCLVKSENENLMISGSLDKDQVLDKEKQCLGLLLDIKNLIFFCSLNLNKSVTQLISCELSNCVKVIEYLPNKQWNITQDQNILIRLSNSIYNYDLNRKSYLPQKQILISRMQQNDSDAFQCQIIQSIKVLCLNVVILQISFKLMKDDYLLQHSIPYDSARLSGRLTFDGQFQINWDSSSCRIQIRKICMNNDQIYYTTSFEKNQQFFSQQILIQSPLINTLKGISRSIQIYMLMLLCQSVTIMITLIQCGWWPTDVSLQLPPSQAPILLLMKALILIFKMQNIYNEIQKYIILDLFQPIMQQCQQNQKSQTQNCL